MVGQITTESILMPIIFLTIWINGVIVPLHVKVLYQGDLKLYLTPSVASEVRSTKWAW